MSAQQDAYHYVIENVGVAFGLPDLDSTNGIGYVIENVGVAFGLPDIDSTNGSHYAIENVMPWELKRNSSEYTYSSTQVFLTTMSSSTEHTYTNLGLVFSPSRESSEYVLLNSIEYILNLAKFWDGNAWVSGLIYNGSTWESPKYWTGSRWSD